MSVQLLDHCFENVAHAPLSQCAFIVSLWLLVQSAKLLAWFQRILSRSFSVFRTRATRCEVQCISASNLRGNHYSRLKFVAVVVKTNVQPTKLHVMLYSVKCDVLKTGHYDLENVWILKARVAVTYATARIVCWWYKSAIMQYSGPTVCVCCVSRIESCLFVSLSD